VPIEPDTLSALASDHAKGMTSIRGRRVQRLLKREFAGADCVLLVQVGDGMPAVLGVSPSGAALCATNGKGKQASVVKWSHGSTHAVETSFDLLKDSLPVLRTSSLPIARVRSQSGLHVPTASVPPQAQPWVFKVLQALA